MLTSEREEKLRKVINARQPDLTIVLENVHDPHNISAVMRTADSVGIQDIYVIYTEKEERKGWGRKSSSSAAKWLNIHIFDSVDECMEIVCKKYNQVLATHLAEKASSLYAQNLLPPTAFIFGNEGHGCSKRILSYATGNFHIPQVGIINSLNISVACAVTIYEAFRQRSQEGYYNHPRLSGQDAHALLRMWSLNKRMYLIDPTRDH